MQLAIDTELSGLDWRRDTFYGLGMCTGTSEAWFEQVVNKKLPDGEQIYFNAPFDYKVLKFRGVRNLKIDHDVQIQAALLGRNGMGLEDLAVHHANFKEWKVKGVYDKARCLMDVKATLALHNRQIKELAKEGLLNVYNNYSMPFCRMIADMEYGGIRVDVDKLREYSMKFAAQAAVEAKGFEAVCCDGIAVVSKALFDKSIAKVKKESAKQARIDSPGKYKLNFNINSGQQLLQLFEYYGIKPTDMDGKPTTDQRILYPLEFKYGEVKQLLAYRKQENAAKRSREWLELLDGDRLYPSYNLGKVVTGRLSCSRPNIQQTPSHGVGRELRECILPDVGDTWVIVDVSQIEPRLAAHFSKDQNLIDVFVKGEDLYGIVAKRIFGLDCTSKQVKELYNEQRQLAKKCTLASIFYGQGEESLAFTLQAEGYEVTEDDCLIFKQEFFKMFPTLKRYKDKLAEEASSRGYVTGIFGQKVWVPAREAGHKPFNYKMQHSASVMNCRAQLQIQKACKEYAKLKALIHDEDLYSCRPDKTKDLKGLLQIYMVKQWEFKLAVPMCVEIFEGDTWGIKK